VRRRRVASKRWNEAAAAWANNVPLAGDWSPYANRWHDDWPGRRQTHHPFVRV